MFLVWWYLTYVAIRAYVRSKKNGTKFTEEAKYVMEQTVRGIKNLVERFMKAFATTATQNDAVENETLSQEDERAWQMQEVAARLDKEVHAHVLRKWPRAHWKYEAINANYQLTHGEKAVVLIDTLTHLKVRAEVIIFNGVVCDVVPIIKRSVDNRAEELQMPAEEDVLGQAAAHKEPEKKEPVAPKQPVVEDDLDHILDPEKAAKVASNYLEDIFLTLNNMGNEAVANGKDRFIFKPDIYGGSLVIDKLCEMIASRGFKSAEKTPEGIEIEVDLDKPADNGNFDFESAEQGKGETEENTIQKVQNDIVSDADQPSPIVEDVDDDIVLPEEPKDIPEV